MAELFRELKKNFFAVLLLAVVAAGLVWGGSASAVLRGEAECFTSAGLPRLFAGGTLNATFVGYADFPANPNPEPFVIGEPLRNVNTDLSVTSLDPSIVAVNPPTSGNNIDKTDANGFVLIRTTLTGVAVGSAQIGVTFGGTATGDVTGTCEVTGLYSVSVAAGPGQSLNVYVSPEITTPLPYQNRPGILTPVVEDTGAMIPGNLQGRTVICGIETENRDNKGTIKANKPIACAFSQEAIDAGVSLWTPSPWWRIDSAGNNASIYCTPPGSLGVRGAIAGAAKWAGNHQLDHGGCGYLYGGHLYSYTLVTPTALNTKYFCPRDSIVVGGKNAPEKNDSWNAFYCAKVLFLPGTAPPPTGTIQVNSKNAITGAPVDSSWTITGPATLTGSNVSAQTYTNQPAGSTYTAAPAAGSAGPLYAFKRLETPAVARSEKSSIYSSFFKSAADILVKAAKAFVVGGSICQTPNPPGPCNSVPSQNLAANGNITFNILWDPVATLGVAPSGAIPLNFTATAGGANPTGTVAVENAGAEGSTLQWSAVRGGANATRLILQAASGSVNIPAASPSASQNVDVTADITGLAPGVYNNFATVTFSGVSLPGSPPIDKSHPVFGSGLLDKTVTVNLTVMAATLPDNHALTVTKAGTGTGTVTSDPPGIDCGADCVEVYADGTAVTLTAAPAPGSTFAGWSGDCAGPGNPCLITMLTNRATTATFNAPGPNGTINVRWTKDGVDGGSSTFSTSYTISGPTAVTCSAPTCIVGRSHPNLQPGSYTLNYTGPNPSGTQRAANFITDAAGNPLSPPYQQTLPGGGSITYTLNFVSVAGPFTLNPPTTSCAGASPRIGLTWAASAGATGYEVWRDGSRLASVGNVLTYTDTVVSSGTDYTYQIRANNGAQSAERDQQAYWCVGDVTVRATLDGASWPSSGTSPMSYTLAGPVNWIGLTVPNTFRNLVNGSWTVNYTAGAPAGAVLSTTRPYSPGPTQSLPQNVEDKPSLTFTINFVSLPDFRLTATPGNQTINQTNTATYDIEVSCVGGYRGPVNQFAVTGLHTNAQASFSPGAASCGDATTLTIRTDRATETGSKILTISGEGVGLGSRSTTAVLNIEPLTPPTAVAVNNYPCEQLTVSWTDRSTNEAGFYIYRNQTGGTDLTQYTRIASRPRRSGSGSVLNYSDTDPLLVVNQVYYYIVTSHFSGPPAPVESVVDPSFPVFALDRPCVPDLTASLKTISRLNGRSYSAGEVIRNGDVVTFRIVIDNTRGEETAVNMVVTDTLTNNLSYEPGTARLRTTCQTRGGSRPGESGSGQNLVWTLGNKPEGLPNWCLDFDAAINSTSVQSVDFFQNTGVISYQDPDGNVMPPVTVRSPLTPIRLDKTRVPTIRESASEIAP